MRFEKFYDRATQSLKSVQKPIILYQSRYKMDPKDCEFIQKIFLAQLQFPDTDDSDSDSHCYM